MSASALSNAMTARASFSVASSENAMPAAPATVETADAMTAAASPRFMVSFFMLGFLAAGGEPG